MYTLPHKLVVPDLAAALAVAPAAARRYRRAMTRHQQAIANSSVRWTALDEISGDSLSRIEALDDHDWALALELAEYLTSTPVTGMMVRQITIDGLHSKWIEQHAVLVLDMICPPKIELPDGSPLTKLRHILGLRAKDLRINVALRCPQLRAVAAGMERFSTTISTLNDSALAPQNLLIIENDQPGYTLTRDIPNLAVLHGLGDSVTSLTPLRWFQTASQVLYWGDIDRAGLQAVASLRRAGIPAHSLLMDCITLDTHEDQAHKATKTQATDQNVPDGLTADERLLYERLNTHFQQTGEEWQLEQEHLPTQIVESALVSACQGPGNRK
ncbi:Uncharacterized protein conserved in bacteria [Mycobacteroides abscessus]|nr:Uncharacterized protein conserved in bacteria [Mycobacteroides abscessus]